MLNINFPIAFSSGVISFFAPCVVSLLPAYLGYVSGVSAEELRLKGSGPYTKKILLSSIFYILGFSLVFVVLGTAAAGLGTLFRRYDFIIQKVGGLLILLFGLQFAGIINLPFLARERKFKLPLWSQGLGYLRAFVIGLIFATAWTPCVGAILGSILTLAAVNGTATQGALLLFVYSLGISLPFILVSLSLATATRHISYLTKHLGLVSKVSGILLALLGILLLTDTYKYLNGWLFEVAFRLGYQIR